MVSWLRITGLIVEIDLKVGKDITRKLYCTSDLANSIINEKSHMTIKASTSGPNFGKGKTW
jgi:hypothetical protein